MLSIIIDTTFPPELQGTLITCQLLISSTFGSLKKLELGFGCGSSGELKVGFGCGFKEELELELGFGC
ncbi:MAG: hypothetical protein ACKO86_03015, partial [Dolichospermum sp.]